MDTTTEQVRQTVREAMHEFEQLADSEQPTSHVLQSMVRTLSGATGGLGAVAWMPTDRSGDSYSAVAHHGRGAGWAVDEQGKPHAAVLQAIRRAVTDHRPLAVSPEQAEFEGTDLHGATQFYVSIDAAGRALGAVLVVCPAEMDPKVYRQYIAFAQRGAGAVSTYLARRQSRVLQQDAAGHLAMLRVTHRLLGFDRLDTLVHELANQGRSLLEAQRVSVIGYRGRRTELAFSDAIDTNRKAVLVRSVEMLADTVRQRQVPMTFRKDQPLDEDDEALSPLLEEVYGLGGAEAICLTPIRSEDRIVGVMVGEYARADEAGRRFTMQQELSQQVGPIMDHTLRLQQRPLRRTSNLLAKIQARPLSALARTALACAAIAAAVWLLFFMPVPIHVWGDARLEPNRIAAMAAPRAGRVVEVLVETGQLVDANQIVARMDDTDPRMELAEVNKAIDGQRVRMAAARAGGEPNAQSEVRAAELKIEQLAIRRDTLLRQIDRSNLRSLIAGVVLTERPGQTEGRTVPEGEDLVQVADLRRFDLVVEVREEDLALVERSLRGDRPVRASFLSRPWPDRPQHATITELTAISPTSAPGEQGQQHVFKVTVPIELQGLSPQLILANPSGRAKLLVGEGSVAYRYGRRVWRFIQMTLLF